MLDHVLVLFDGPRVSMIGDFQSSWLEPGIFDARGDDVIVAPGLIDVHVHGGGGADFLDRTEKSFHTISETAARGGATSVIATTTIPVDDEQLESFAEFVRILKSAKTAGARFAGVHLEGPFLNPEKRGGFGLRFIQKADLKHAEKILSLCEDVLAKITISPEIENGEPLIRLFAENPRTQIEVSLGHTSAGYDMAQRYFEHERVRQVTHAFNAMHPFHHREPSLIGAALHNEQVWLEMIPDGYHLTGPAIKLLHRTKGPRKLIIVTDGTAATATEPGTKIRSVGGITEVKDGAVRLEDGALAGSNLLMAGAVMKAVELGGVPLEHAIEMSSLTPAKSVHLDDRIGSIDAGKQADLCVMRTDGTVLATIRDAELIYSAAQ